MQSELLDRLQKTDVRIAIQHRQKRHFFSPGAEQACHFQSHEAAQRVSNQEVRAPRLHFLDRTQIEVGHISNVVKRFVSAIQTLGLHSIDGIWALHVLHDLKKVHYAATQTMRNEDWPRLATGLQQYDWRASWRS